MKRLVFSVAAIFLLAILAVFANNNSQAKPLDNIQFAGVVKYAGGSPAPSGTEVRVFLGSTLKATVYLQHSDGRYQVLGDDDDYPTGNYTLKGDDLVGMLGVESNVSHTIHVSTDRDIVLDTAY